MPLTGEKTSESTNTSTSNIIDYLSLVKATQAISEEIVIENLLKRVMHVILENTGAQHGVILIEKGGKLFIHAEGVQKENQISTLFLNEPFSKTSKLPYSLIYYVGKTQEQVLANSPKSPFFKDAYFTGKEVKAALCLPIKQHGTNVGILYLEHFLNIYAFNVNNLKAINLILAQVSISFENARLYASYGRFVPKEFLQNLNRSNINEISLGDRIERNMTVLFADMSEFITLTKDLTDDEIFDFINEFLSRCSPIIYKHGGFVDKYIGDAIMGLFTTEPDNALLAAKEIAQSILEWNSSPHRIDIPPINIEIGINTGPLILGVIGEAERLESSVLGDTVNIASRIQAINKMYNSTILISGETKAKLAQPENYQMEFLESVQLRGKQKLIEIWKLGTVQS